MSGQNLYDFETVVLLQFLWLHFTIGQITGIILPVMTD